MGRKLVALLLLCFGFVLGPAVGSGFAQSRYDDRRYEGDRRDFYQHNRDYDRGYDRDRDYDRNYRGSGWYNDRRHHEGRSLAIVGGSAAAGAAVGAVTGGGKGAAVGALIGGVGGLVVNQAVKHHHRD